MATMNQRVATRQKWAFTIYVTFYWVGVIMSLLCIGLAFARNTELVWNVQPAGFPLSWAAGLIAILAFLASECCHQAVPATRAKDPGARRSSEDRIEASSWDIELADV